MKCSHCGSLACRPLPRRHAFYPAAYLVYLGLPLAMFHQASAPREFRCLDCGKDSAERTVLRRIMFFLSMVGAVSIAVAFLLMLLFLILR
jgi:hypothetical protein